MKLSKFKLWGAITGLFSRGPSLDKDEVELPKIPPVVRPNGEYVLSPPPAKHRRPPLKGKSKLRRKGKLQRQARKKNR